MVRSSKFLTKCHNIHCFPAQHISHASFNYVSRGSTDYNAPTENKCFDFMDKAILGGGVNLIDTAEQYPIPTGYKSKEGDTEKIIGKWLKDRKVSRKDVVISTKISGGR